jgi:deazaflavin-dependent oxidoreductase (nitroreductase family)
MTDEIGAQLAAWGKVLMIETRGRQTGRPARTPLGFVEEPGGSWLVSAGAADADWALNLDASGRASIELDGRRIEVAAEPLDDAEHARAVRQLILRYGTPAERLGAGPSFRLRALDAERAAAAPGDIPP